LEEQLELLPGNVLALDGVASANQAKRGQ